MWQHYAIESATDFLLLIFCGTSVGMAKSKTTAVTVKRRKPAKARKDEQVRIRLTTEQKDAFTEAATNAGLDVSSWLRWLGVREVQRAQGAAPEATKTT